MESTNPTGAPTSPSSVQPPLSASEPRSPVFQPALAPVPAPAPAPASTPAPSLGLNHHEHDRTLRKWRLGIRILTATFIAISMILFIARGAILMNRYSEQCSGYRCYYNYGYEAYDFISLPILGAAMIWNIAEFITFCVNRRGAHPGVHVGLDLVMWCSLLAGGVVAVFQWSYGYGYHDDDSGLGTAGAALELLSCAGHFTLFILACIATHKRRMLFKRHILALQTQLAARQSVSYASPPTAMLPPAPPGMTYYLLPTKMQPQARYHELDQSSASAQMQETGLGPGSSAIGMAHHGPAMTSNTERYA